MKICLISYFLLVVATVALGQRYSELGNTNSVAYSNLIAVEMFPRTTNGTKSITVSNLAKSIGPFLTNSFGGAATNAVATVSTNSVNVFTAVRELNVLTGSNVLLTANLVGSRVDLTINGTATGNSVSTNGNQFGASTALTMKDGLWVTNLSGFGSGSAFSDLTTTNGLTNTTGTVHFKNNAIIYNLYVVNSLGANQVDATNVVAIRSTPGLGQGRLQIHATNNNSYAAILLADDWKPTNYFRLDVTNAIAGQVLKVASASISGGLATIVLTNGPADEPANAVLTNLVNTVGQNVTNGQPVFFQIANGSIAITNQNLTNWSTVATNIYTTTNDAWLTRYASNGVVVSAGASITVSAVGSGGQMTYQVAYAGAIGGAATNAIASIFTNGVAVVSVATNLSLTSGTNTIWTFTNTSGNVQGAVHVVPNFYSQWGLTNKGPIVFTPTNAIGAASSIGTLDGNVGTFFTNQLTSNTTWRVSNLAIGQVLWLFSTNTATYTETWDQFGAGNFISGNVESSSTNALNVWQVWRPSGAQTNIQKFGVEYSLTTGNYLLESTNAATKTIMLTISSALLTNAAAAGYIVTNVVNGSTNGSGMISVINHAANGDVALKTLSQGSFISISDNGTNVVIAGTAAATVTNSFSITNILDVTNILVDWAGPPWIRIAPTNDATINFTNYPAAGQTNAYEMAIEVLPGGYTNLFFESTIKWVQEAPRWVKANTNFFIVQTDGTNVFGLNVFPGFTGTGFTVRSNQPTIYGATLNIPTLSSGFLNSSIVGNLGTFEWTTSFGVLPDWGISNRVVGIGNDGYLTNFTFLSNYFQVLDRGITLTNQNLTNFSTLLTNYFVFTNDNWLLVRGSNGVANRIDTPSTMAVTTNISGSVITFGIGLTNANLTNWATLQTNATGDGVFVKSNGPIVRALQSVTSINAAGAVSGSSMISTNSFLIIPTPANGAPTLDIYQTNGTAYNRFTTLDHWKPTNAFRLDITNAAQYQSLRIGSVSIASGIATIPITNDYVLQGESSVTNGTMMGFVNGTSGGTNLLRSINMTVGTTNALANQGTNINIGVTRVGTYRTIYVNASAMVSNTTAGATFSTTESATPTNAMVDQYTFSDATTNWVQFTLAMPKEWDTNTLKCKIFWTTTNNIANSTNVWGVAGTFYKDGTVMSNATWGTEFTITNKANGAGKMMLSPATPTITLGNTPAGEGLVWFRIRRLGGAADDAMLGSAQLLGAWIQYLEHNSEQSSW